MRPLLYVQGVIEIVGGVFLLVGVYTRVVAFILAGDMARSDQVTTDIPNGRNRAEGVVNDIGQHRVGSPLSRPSPQ
jgi:DoxX